MLGFHNRGPCKGTTSIRVTIIRITIGFRVLGLRVKGLGVRFCQTYPCTNTGPTVARSVGFREFGVVGGLAKFGLGNLKVFLGSLGLSSICVGSSGPLGVLSSSRSFLDCGFRVWGFQGC